MPREKFLLRCTSCGFVSGYMLNHVCRNCGHLVDPFYFGRPKLAGRTMRRFADLLPFDESSFGFLLDDIPRTSLTLTEFKGAKLFLKNETLLSTRTTKDRMAVAALATMLANAVGEYVVSSTGNSSSSFIYYTGKLGGAIKCHVFAAKSAAHRIRYENPHCEIHMVDGDFVEAGKIAKRFAADNGLYWEGGFFNYARREGLKTAYLEAFEQMDYDCDVVIQTVSSGMGILGGYKGYQEMLQFGKMNKRVSFICVQQDTCMPMVRAFNSGLNTMSPEFITPNPKGLAEAVLRGDPSGSYPYICNMLRSSGGKLIAISQSSLRAARNELVSLGVDGCYASAASYAAAKHLRDVGFIKAKDRVLVMITGAQHS
jgi:threonine synthase